MRAVLFAGLAAVLVAVAGGGLPAVAQPPKDAQKEPAKSDAKNSAAAELTRTKLLKTKVGIDATDVPLGEILKEFSHLVDEKNDQPVFWAYGANFPFAQKVTFAVRDMPLEVALDQLLTKAGGKLGYVVVSKSGDKYDGWVRLTTTNERGYEPPPPPAATAAEETEAADKLALAKKLIDGGKSATAKTVLEIVVRKFPTTKAGVEAKELLGKIEKDK